MPLKNDDFVLKNGRLFSIMRYDESGNIDSCDLPFDIATVALSQVLPGLRHHDHMRDRLLVSFATARENVFVIGSVTVPVPDMWGSSAVPMGE